MSELTNKLRKYIKGNPDIMIEKDDYDTTIVDAKTGDLYANIYFSDDGSFSGFEIDPYNEEEGQEEEESPPHTPLSEREIADFLQKGDQFVADFLTAPVEFGMFSEWLENSYIMIYEEIDQKLDIPIPHTGCTLYFNRKGEITSANLGHQRYMLEYPNVTITNEEAKAIFLHASVIELVIQAEGDGNVELIYRMNPAYIGVKVNGEIDNVLEFMGAEEIPVYPLKETVVKESIETMLGITNDFVMFKDDGESKLWVEKDIFDAAEDTEEIVHKVSTFEDETGFFIESNVVWEKSDTPLSLEVLQEQAISFLESVVGDVHTKYCLEEPQHNEDELTEEDSEIILEVEDLDDLEMDDDFFPSEPTQMFTFQRYHKGMKIESYDIYIHVGLFTGIIRECSGSKLNESQLQALNIKPSIPLEEVEERFFQEIDLKLTRCVKDFDDTSVYTLSFTVDYPGEMGAIEKINAHTGRVTYVDTGIIRETL
ncbi:MULTISPECIES: hypothetical protein [Bacillaceae]|uniref:DUF2262 domain-containing protein n=1 Tax=Evansella alkalicola TaxID=745819 RepID=A0ABS6JMU6_9BACI|nr:MULTISPECIES: hypothetical protein [Bacillaceae]MBU9719888.1 hypothetical protein [Bacillus alkalicola]